MSVDEIKKKVRYRLSDTIREMDGDLAKKLLEEIWDETYSFDTPFCRHSKMQKLRAKFREKLILFLCMAHVPTATPEELNQIREVASNGIRNTL